MTTDAITTAQAPDTFDVLSFIEHTAYPKSSVTLFTDARSVTELVELNAKRKLAESDGEVSTEYDARIEELIEKVNASKLTFELQGMPPGMVRDLYDVDEEDDKTRLDAENDLIAHTIVSVTNASGSRDTRVFDKEAVSKLRRHLKEGEFGKLITGVVEVNFNASVFDEATDAGFLG